MKKKYPNSYYRELRQKNLERYRKREIGYYNSKRELYLDRVKKHYLEHPELSLRAKLKRYNLTLEEFNEWSDKQKGLCFICQKPNHKGKKIVSLGVDHDHKTGKNRGLLCNKCNSVLGYVDDDVKLLKKFIKYLTRKE